VADQSAMVQDSVEYVIQVNGKLRGSIHVAKTETKEALEKLALRQPFVQKFIEENMSVRKVIVVPNKLINVVVG
jgi:leucyl-tRNA synthetase